MTSICGPVRLVVWGGGKAGADGEDDTREEEDGEASGSIFNPHSMFNACGWALVVRLILSSQCLQLIDCARLHRGGSAAALRVRRHAGGGGERVILCYL